MKRIQEVNTFRVTNNYHEYYIKLVWTNACHTNAL